MKSKLLKVWIIGFFFIYSAMCGVLHAANSNLTTYTNKNYGFKLNYPSDWEIKEKYGNNEAAFLSQPENSSDRFRETVGIGVVSAPIPSDANLSEARDVIIQQLSSVITNFSLVADQHVTLAGRDAYAIVYTGTMGAYQLQCQQIFTVRGGYIYALTFVAEQKSYNKFFPYFNQIASSFTFN